MVDIHEKRFKDLWRIIVGSWDVGSESKENLVRETDSYTNAYKCDTFAKRMSEAICDEYDRKVNEAVAEPDEIKKGGSVWNFIGEFHALCSKYDVIKAEEDFSHRFLDSCNELWDKYTHKFSRSIIVAFMCYAVDEQWRLKRS